MFSDKTSSGYSTAKVVTKKYWSFLNKLSLFAKHLSWLAGTKFKNVKSENALASKLESKLYFFGIHIFII